MSTSSLVTLARADEVEYDRFPRRCGEADVVFAPVRRRFEGDAIEGDGNESYATEGDAGGNRDDLGSERAGASAPISNLHRSGSALRAQTHWKD